MTKKRYTDFQVEVEVLVITHNDYSTYEASRLMGIPQSTLWWHLTVRLKDLDYSLWEKSRRQLEGKRRGGGR